MPGARSAREHALAKPGPDAGVDLTTVLLERGLAFEGGLDRFDSLSNPAELAEPGVVAAARRRKAVSSLAILRSKLLAGESFVSTIAPTLQQLALADAFEHRERNVAV